MKKLLRLLAGLAALALSALPAAAQGSLNMVCAPAADWCEAIAAGFQRDTGIRVAMTRKSSGEILAQIRAEAQNPRTDIWFGASAETHFSAAEGNLLQPLPRPIWQGCMIGRSVCMPWPVSAALVFHPVPSAWLGIAN